VTDSPKTSWRCPACAKHVSEHRPYVAALEGEDGADFGLDCDPIWLRPVRFHEGHFRPRIRGKVYLLEDLLETVAAPVAPPIVAVRAAYEALNDGEVEPLVALMDEDVAWSGQRSGVRFWRPPPA
jgi:hypothetical protein